MKFNVPDMSCGHCKASVEQALTAMDPAAKVTVDLGAKTVEVETARNDAAVIAALGAVGFPATTA